MKPLLIFFTLFLMLGGVASAFLHSKSKNKFYFKCEVLDHKNKLNIQFLYRVEGNYIMSETWDGENTFKAGKEIIEAPKWKITQIDSNIIRGQNENSKIYVNFVSETLSQKWDSGRGIFQENCKKLKNK